MEPVQEKLNGALDQDQEQDQERESGSTSSWSEQLQLMGACAARAVLPAPTGEYVTTGGRRLHFLSLGEGEPLILLHGFGLNAYLNFIATGIAQHFTPGFRVILPDLFGHGKSDVSHEPEDYGHRMVDDVVGLMNYLEIEHARIGGYSLGSGIALRCLASHPDRFKSGLLMAAGWRENSTAFQECTESIAQELEQESGNEQLRAQLLHGDADFQTIAVCLAMHLMQAWTDTRALAAVMRAMPELTIDEQVLRKCTTPTYGLCGTADPLFEDAQALAATKPQHRLVALSDATHFNLAFNPLFHSLLSEHADQIAPARRVPTMAQDNQLPHPDREFV